MVPQSHIEKLAPELLLTILTHLPDLTSLDNILTASPAAYRLFDSTHAIKLFNTILLSGNTHEYTSALIRIIIPFRSGTLPPHIHSLNDFQEMVTHDTTSHRYDPPDWEHLPLVLAPDTPAAVLRGMLATNRMIVHRTACCLDYYLERFKALRPKHLLDKDFQFVSEFQGLERRYVPSWQLKPAENPFPVQDIGPCTWLEQQRVLRAYWRVQLGGEIQNAARKGVMHWSVDGMSVIDLCCYVDIDNLLDDNDHDENSYGEPYVYQQGTLLERELLESVLHYEENSMRPVSVPAQLGFAPFNISTISEDDREVLGWHTSITYTFFYKLGGRPGHHIPMGPCSPLQHVAFKPFRGLGFAIWSRERMVAYGFLDPDARSDQDHTYFLAWKSVLGHDTIEQVEQGNQAWDERCADRLWNRLSSQS
jgi:hypothetical protein